MDRKMQLAAALILFRRACDVSPFGALWSSESDQDELDTTLEQRAAEAQKTLRDYRESRALRLALDSLLPGWRYINASDFLPREKWRAFISDIRGEWEQWLREQGVGEDSIGRLLDRW